MIAKLKLGASLHVDQVQESFSINFSPHAKGHNWWHTQVGEIIWTTIFFNGIATTVKIESTEIG